MVPTSKKDIGRRIAVSPARQNDVSRYLFRVGQHAALDLVSFPTCEKRLEIALAETVIALALDVLEKNRTSSIAAKSTGRSNLI